MVKRSFNLVWGIIGFVLILAIIMAIGLFWLIVSSIGIFIMSIVYYILAIKSNNPQQISIARIVLVVTTLLIMMVMGFAISFFGLNIDNPFDKSIWAKEITPIEEFDYYVDGNNVYLKEYKGKSKRVKINSTYTIDGKNYNVIEFSKGLFVLGNVYSVILPEGLISMPSNTFNSCGIKYVYIPSTLKNEDSSYGFYKYFHNLEKIYYGGTEEQWKSLTNNTERSEMGTKQIIFNAKINELPEQ